MKSIYIYLLFLFVLFYICKTKNNNNTELVIIKNFYSPSQFNKIKKLVQKNKQFKNDQRVSSRKTICLFENENKQLYNHIYNNKLNKIIKNLTQHTMIPSDYPIEYRMYPTGSSGMQWHKDLSLYKKSYYEAVLTIENNSDQQFKYIENGQIKTIYPEANTLVLVQPKSILHKVTSISKGIRTIIKFIVLYNDQKKNYHYYEQLNKCPT